MKIKFLLAEFSGTKIMGIRGKRWIASSGYGRRI
jgi:hypothetical protein